MGKIEIKTDLEKTKKRISKFEEMEKIWEMSDEPVRAYLEGCIHTAAALSTRDKKAG